MKNGWEHFAILDDLDPGVRRGEFKSLKNGWLDGKGLAPTHKSLDWLADAFQRNYPGDLPLPYIYPTAEGGVQAEWSVGGWEISLDINLDQRKGEWHALKMESDAEEKKILDLNTSYDWQWLAAEIVRRIGEAA